MGAAHGAGESSARAAGVAEPEEEAEEDAVMAQYGISSAQLLAFLLAHGAPQGGAAGADAPE